VSGEGFGVGRGSDGEVGSDGKIGSGESTLRDLPEAFEMFWWPELVARQSGGVNGEELLAIKKLCHIPTFLASRPSAIASRAFPAGITL
jgi:hypothetical protein